MVKLPKEGLADNSTLDNCLVSFENQLKLLQSSFLSHNLKVLNLVHHTHADAKESKYFRTEGLVMYVIDFSFAISHAKNLNPQAYALKSGIFV